MTGIGHRLLASVGACGPASVVVSFNAAAQSNRGDPPPNWPTDGCRYWETVPGFGVLFAIRDAELGRDERTRSFLDLVAQGWRDEDRGYILLAGYQDQAETAKRGTHLDRRRAEVVRDALIGRSVPREAIGLRTIGFADRFDRVATSIPDQEYRRVTIRNTHRGQA